MNDDTEEIILATPTAPTLPSAVNPDDLEATYFRSQAALSALEMEVARFPAALANAVETGDVGLILSLRRRRVEASVELQAAQLQHARDLVCLREERSALAVASVSLAYAPLAHTERVLAEAQAMHQTALNDYVQACTDRDFGAHDLRQARSEFIKLSNQQVRDATDAALRQQL